MRSAGKPFQSQFARLALLGFSKSEIAPRVADAVEKIKVNVTPTLPPNVDIDFLDVKPHEPTVSFAEPELTPTTPEADSERTPSELGASVISESTNAPKPIDGESTTTAPSLFDDEVVARFRWRQGRISSIPWALLEIQRHMTASSPTRTTPMIHQ